MIARSSNYTHLPVLYSHSYRLAKIGKKQSLPVGMEDGLIYILETSHTPRIETDERTENKIAHGPIIRQNLDRFPLQFERFVGPTVRVVNGEDSLDLLNLGAAFGGGGCAIRCFLLTLSRRFFTFCRFSGTLGRRFFTFCQFSGTLGGFLFPFCRFRGKIRRRLFASYRFRRPTVRLGRLIRRHHLAPSQNHKRNQCEKYSPNCESPPLIPPRPQPRPPNRPRRPALRVDRRRLAVQPPSQVIGEFLCRLIAVLQSNVSRLAIDRVEIPRHVPHESPRGRRGRRAADFFRRAWKTCGECRP